jgi:hypothetical protein
MGDNRRVPMTSADDAAAHEGPQPDAVVPSDPPDPPDPLDPLDPLDPPDPLDPLDPLDPPDPVAAQDPEPGEAEPDPVAAAAVELAREAAVSIAEPDTVGDHLSVTADAPGIVTHAFACRSKGYRGWYWAVTVVHAPDDDAAPTVSDTVLLPGGEAILAPAWVPWSDRLAPGDLRSTDVLAFRADDPYLEPGYTTTDDEEADQVALWELGLGRPRVLGPTGRAAASERWYLGDRGPTAEEAIHAAAPCSTCGYFLPMPGALRRVFGVCSNEWSPSDAKVVSVDHGCGAHSETDVEAAEPVSLPTPILDETGTEYVVLPPKDTDESPSGEAPAGEAPADEVPAESPSDEVPAESPADEVAAPGTP